MAKLRLTIDMDNSSFEGENLPQELSDIFAGLAIRLENMSRDFIFDNYSKNRNVYDSNGNDIGKIVITDILD